MLVTATLGCLIIAALFAGSASAQVPSDLAVDLYTRGAIQIEVLAKARGEAERIFGAAGIRLRWLDANRPLSRIPQVSLAVLSGQQADEVLPSMGSGFDLLGRAATAAMRGYVHYDRAVKIARQHYTDPGVLLGRVFAHEMVHLLNQTGEHAASGLMALELNFGDRGKPVLTASEATSVRTALARRADTLVAGVR